MSGSVQKSPADEQRGRDAGGRDVREDLAPKLTRASHARGGGRVRSRGLGIPALVLGFVAGVAAACGGDGTGPVSPPPPPPPPPNRPPTAVGTLPALSVAAGESSEVRVSGAFSDPDGDALSYTAATSNADVATVSMAAGVATVAGVGKGVATISVTATDPGGASARQNFQVTVPNRAPEATGTIPAVELAVDETETVDVSQYFTDPDGDDLGYSAASSDTALATVAVSGNALTVTALAAGTATITVTATDPDTASAEQSFDVTVPNRAPEPTDAMPDLELAVGDSTVIALEDHFRDPDGDALTYARETSDETVAVASVSGATLTVRAVAKGTATITVTATDDAGLTASASFDVTVPNRAPIVTDTIPAQRLTEGDTREWVGRDYFTDPDGDALTFAAGTTDAASVLAVASGGEFGIVALAAGTATVTITATDADGLGTSHSFGVTVEEARGAVIITEIEPAVLIEGGDATIRGSGFSSVPADNAVTLDGLAATVTAASGTSLSIIVPKDDCFPPRRAELRVTVGGRSGVRTVGVTPLSRDELALPPGHYRYSSAGFGCMHLPGDPAGGDYIIGVVSTSEYASSLTSVTMTSVLGDATVATDAPVVSTSGPRALATAAAGVPPDGFAMTSVPPSVPPSARGSSSLDAPRAGPRRDWSRHNEIMAANEELLRRLDPLPASMARARQAAVPAVNDTLTLFAGFAAGCQRNDRVRAVVRLVGENAVWLDDLDNPSGTFEDSELAEMDAFYGSHIRGVHDDYFGPLSDVDGNGRVLILMTKEANRHDLGGWVFFLDLLPSDSCAGSNHAEIFYGQVPEPDGVYGSPWTKQEVLDYYPSLIAHEITHIVQANAIMFGGAQNFAPWQLEGGATLSEELVGYRLFGHGSGLNLGHAEWQSSDSWYWYYKWVLGLARFFGWDSDDDTGASRVPYAPEQCSWVGRLSDGNDGPCRRPVRAVYDVPSVLFRYALDRWGGDYAGGERALMRDLSRAPEWGLSSLAAVSGWRIERILAGFYLTLWADLNGFDPRGMRSWNLADIWSHFYESTWLRPYTSTWPAFEAGWSIRAGSTVYLRWTPAGSREPTSLRVTLSDGTPVPNHISVWALRLR